MRERKISVFRVFNALCMLLLGFLTFYPIWYCICAAFSTYGDIIGMKMLWYPVNPTWSYMDYMFSSPDFLHMYGNTLFVVSVGTICSLLSTSMIAYAFSRNVAGHSVIEMIVYFTILFSGGMIPTYLVVRATGLINTLWALFIPNLINPFYIFLLRNFFQTIPISLDESAGLDGAGPLRIMLSIILPISAPGLATIALFYGVGYWNAYFNVIIYANKRNLWTIQVLLREVITSSSDGSVMGGASDTVEAAVTFPIKMAVVVATVIPIMCIYPFLQKYFVKGTLIGSVKG